jgi:hypothetical protein
MTRTRQTRQLVVLASALLIAVGCSSQKRDEQVSGAGDDEQANVSLNNSPTEEQKAKMIAAKDRLFAQLTGRLMEVMAAQGPVAAIAVCKSEASEIAKSVGQQEGVKIGRTALKLRNPKNQPPSWSESLIAAATDQPTFLTLDDGRGAALLPIKLKALCLLCHGPADQIMPEIKDQLATHYPDDQATGFEEGDLRGWFWVETIE